MQANTINALIDNMLHSTSCWERDECGVVMGKIKKGKLITSHRYDLLPLLRSSPEGIQRELVV